jgi:hypothetical protein
MLVITLWLLAFLRAILLKVRGQLLLAGSLLFQVREKVPLPSALVLVEQIRVITVWPLDTRRDTKGKDSTL